MTVKGKAETKKDEDSFERFAKYLENMADHLNWEEREILETDPEAKMVLHQIDLEVRVQDLELGLASTIKKHQDLVKKHQDLVDNLRIFIGKEEV